MCALERVAALCVEDADQVDHRVGTFEFAAQHVIVVDIGGADSHLRQHAEFAMLLAILAE